MSKDLEFNLEKIKEDFIYELVMDYKEKSGKLPSALMLLPDIIPKAFLTTMKVTVDDKDIPIVPRGVFIA